MKPLMNVYFVDQSLKTKRGNAILAVMMSLAVIFISYTTLTNSIVEYKKKVLSVKNDLDLRLALHSTMDFVIFGLKQQYCFDSVLMQDANCDLKHEASTERLIMNNDQLNYIKAMIETGAIKDIASAEDVILNKITRKMTFSAASTAHPLYVIFSQNQLSEVATGVEVVIERDRSLFLPRYGSEVYLNIKVSFIGITSTAASKWNASRFTLTSKVAIHPRELGSFALLIAKDLRLDKTHSEVLANGDVAINQFTTNVEAVKAYKGLTFLSPVFVNEDIHLPHSASGDHFNPVTFADKVYMGNGSVYKAGVPYKPISTGGYSDRYWISSGEGFGGFLKGVENDGGLDKGLSVFGKVGTATQTLADYNLMKQCIERSQDRVNNVMVFQNSMNVTTSKFVRSGSVLNSIYQLKLTNGDEFTYQGDKLEDYASYYGWSKGNNASPYKFYRRSTSNPGTLLTTEINFVSSNTMKTILFDMSTDNDNAASDEYVELTVDNSAGYVASLDQKIAAIDAQLIIKNNELTTIKTNLANLLLGTPTQEEIDAANKAKSDKEKEIVDLSAQKQAYVDDKNSAGTLSSKPAKIKMYIENSYTSKGYRENDKLNLIMQIENEKSLIDDKGEQFKIKTNLQGWNLGFYRKVSTYKDEAGDEVNNDGLKKSFYSEPNQSSSLYNSPTYLTPSTNNTSTFDYAALDALCEEKRNAQSSQSFGSAGYDQDFSPTTRASWNFSGGPAATIGADPALVTLTFDGTNASTAANSSFQVRSIVGHCIIASTATFVTGFLTCDKLTISARTLPLRIIATIIAGKVNIDPSALSAGIVWSSVYHPQSTYELRNMYILRPILGGAATDCSSVSASNLSSPIWHPKPSIQTFSNRENCNVISLRAKADPFRWTAVDPDCGLISGNSNTICKHKLNRFFVFEHSRGNE